MATAMVDVVKIDRPKGLLAASKHPRFSRYIDDVGKTLYVANSEICMMPQT